MKKERISSLGCYSYISPLYELNMRWGPYEEILLVINGRSLTGSIRLEINLLIGEKD